MGAGFIPSCCWCTLVQIEIVLGKSWLLFLCCFGRQQLRQLAEGHQQQAGFGSLVKSVESASLHTDASPEMHGRCQDAQATGTPAPDADAGQQASAQCLPGVAPCAQVDELSQVCWHIVGWPQSCSWHAKPSIQPVLYIYGIYASSTSRLLPCVAFCLQKLAKLQAEVAEQTALLEVAQGDLSRDEAIFADKAKEVARLQAELDSAAERAQRREQAMAARLQHMQAYLRRCVLRGTCKEQLLAAICADYQRVYKVSLSTRAENHLINGITCCTGYRWRLDWVPPSRFSRSLLR